MLNFWLRPNGVIALGPNCDPVLCNNCPPEDDDPGDTVEGACDLCSGGVPNTFNVTIQNMLNGGCASCQTVLHGQYSVSYVGTVDCSGTEWHLWESSADLFGSPGSCSGIFDDRYIAVRIRNNGGNCEFRVALLDDTDGPCTVPGASNSFRMYGSATVTSGNPCSDTVEITATNIFNTSDCDQDLDDFIPPHPSNWVLFS